MSNPDVQLCNFQWPANIPLEIKTKLQNAMVSRGWTTFEHLSCLSLASMETIVKELIPQTEDSSIAERSRMEMSVWFQMTQKRNVGVEKHMGRTFHEKSATVVGFPPSPMLDVGGTEIEKMAENLATTTKNWPQAELGMIISHALAWVSSLLCLIQIAGVVPDILIPGEFLSHILSLWNDTKDPGRCLEFYKTFREELSARVARSMSSGKSKTEAILFILREGNEVLANRLRVNMGQPGVGQITGSRVPRTPRATYKPESRNSTSGNLLYCRCYEIICSKTPLF
jgi:hypothetical protein